jgi:hypothetical protein
MAILDVDQVFEIEVVYDGNRSVLVDGDAAIAGRDRAYSPVIMQDKVSEPPSSGSEKLCTPSTSFEDTPRSRNFGERAGGTAVKQQKNGAKSDSGGRENDSKFSFEEHGSSEISRRLVEYFVVVSSVPKVRKTNDGEKLPRLTDGGGLIRKTPLKRYQSSQVAARVDVRRAHLGRFLTEGSGSAAVKSMNEQTKNIQENTTSYVSGFKSLEKKFEKMNLDKTLSKLKTMKERGNKQKIDEDDQSCSSEDSSFSLDGRTSRNTERPPFHNVEGATFRPSAQKTSLGCLSPAPPPPMGLSMSAISERPFTPKISPLPERQTASQGVSENIRIGHDSCNQQYNDGASDCKLEPVITAQYPPVDHPDQPLNPMLPKFCYPQGDVIVPLREYKMATVHYFVLTDSRGGKMYGTCLTVYEELTPHSEIEIVSGERNDSISSLKGGQERGFVECSVDGSPEKLRSSRSAENQKYYAPRVLCLLSTWPYLSAFRTYLTQLYRLATTTNLMTAPLERYILNICSEVPPPPPGSFRVNVSILDSKIGFWAPPADQPIPYVSLPYEILFECLDVGNVLFVWYTLACERKVLLVSGQMSLLTVCAEILCSMLFPLRWSHLYIPW